MAKRGLHVAPTMTKAMLGDYATSLNSKERSQTFAFHTWQSDLALRQAFSVASTLRLGTNALHEYNLPQLCPTNMMIQYGESDHTACSEQLVLKRSVWAGVKRTDARRGTPNRPPWGLGPKGSRCVKTYSVLFARVTHRTCHYAALIFIHHASPQTGQPASRRSGNPKAKQAAGHSPRQPTKRPSDQAAKWPTHRSAG